MAGFVQLIELVLTKTVSFLNKNGFIVNITEFVLDMNGFVFNMTGPHRYPPSGMQAIDHTM